MSLCLLQATCLVLGLIMYSCKQRQIANTTMYMLQGLWQHLAMYSCKQREVCKYIHGAASLHLSMQTVELQAKVDCS